ncbi:hypothetical protein ANO11243_078400 [Dothideomycetidae sp. 11243]|nr:hypothetical protein ANO11243_078400 [fungal sp. No.11243]
MEEALDYRNWPAERLVTRVAELEAKLKALTQEAKGLPVDSPSQSGSAKRRAKKAKKDSPNAFDASRYSTRFIALKFAYLGQRYNGLEYVANNPTPLSTVEEELWKALHKTRLIFPTGEAAERGEISWEGCEYSKCGRTDRGVSAFGQVVALRVRSARPVPGLEPRKKKTGDVKEAAQEEEAETTEEPEKEFDPIRDELPYIQMLNRVLPHDIRALAWCPDPPEGFSARFSCEERRYRYFFTNPAFAPGWLDIEAMQDAAKRLEGLHDFRNFCKIDPTKQISNHERRIYHASIEEVDMRRHPVGSNGQDRSIDVQTPKLYSFNVNGSAFLWHQVRNMVAVIFLVGQGLESPSVVSDLLDPEKTPTRPKYEMASDAPLVLWDCIFPEKGDPERGRDNTKLADADGGDGKFGRNGIMDSLWTTWRQRKIDELLAGGLLDLVASQGRQTSLGEGNGAESHRSTRIFEGANSARAIGKYIPIMQKERMEHFSVINARYLEKKNLKDVEKAAGQSVEADE